MTPDHDRCKDQRAMCWELFRSELNSLRTEDKIILERLNGMDKAIINLGIVHEHRFKELNELRKEYVKDRNVFVLKGIFDGLVQRVTKLETRSTVWITVIVIFFTILQVALKWWK